MTDRPMFDPDMPDDELSIEVRGFTRYAQVPTWVVRHPLVSDRAVRLYVTLWGFADWTTGEARVSRRRLADAMRRDVKSVDRAVRDLIAVGALTVESAAFAGRQGWNVYALQWTDPEGGTEMSPLGGQNGRPGGDKNVAPYSYGNIQSRESSSGSAEAVDLLERWWRARGALPTRSLIKRWLPVAVEWIALDGPTSDDWIQGAVAAGIETPGGWPYHQTKPDDDDRWDRLRDAIDTAETA